MKTLLLSLLFACTLTAAAQQAQITGFTAAGMLTWTNAETNVYCGVEWTMDLEYSWFPFMSTTWDILATSSVQSVALPLDVFGVINFASEDLNSRMNHHFFRLATFDQPRNVMAVTNWIRILNVSDNNLTNVAVGHKRGNILTTNNTFAVLAPQNSTAFVPVADDYGPLDTLGWSSDWDGWFVKYDHLDTNRFMGTIVFFIGPPRKDVSVTVSNTGAQISLDWLSDLKRNEPY